MLWAVHTNAYDYAANNDAVESYDQTQVLSREEFTRDLFETEPPPFNRRYLEPDSIAYLKTHEPIGCRDQQTCDWLLERGVDAYYSKCLTLTFPKREREPEDGKVFLVDVEYYPVPKALRKRGHKVSQMTVPFYDDETKRKMMRQLLETYKNEASLVVTSKLHCVGGVGFVDLASFLLAESDCEGAQVSYNLLSTVSCGSHIVTS